MPVLRNIGLLATCRSDGPQRAIHTIPDAAVAWVRNRITYVGPEADLPPTYQSEDALDANGRLVIPGLIDCHTHLCFGGWRADEFDERLSGANQLEINRRGGGFLRTVRETREASLDDLVHSSRTLLDEMAAAGVTTVECKSGYGLDVEHEKKQLRVYSALKDRHPMRLVPTFLAQGIPPEYRENRSAYVRLLTQSLLPDIALENLATFCDVYIDDSAFSVPEARTILEQASILGLGLKISVDRFVDDGGGAFAADMKVTSADHLDRTSRNSIRALARSETVAVSLPQSALYGQYASMPARTLIQAQVPVAVASDLNPGTAPIAHLPFVLMLACTLQQMTPAEVLKGATIIAARALNLDDRIGSIEVGKAADMVVIDAPDVAHWLFRMQRAATTMTIMGGTVWTPPAD